MAITQAQLCWLHEQELLALTDPIAQWQHPKGATVYLLAKTWLERFREAVKAVGESGEVGVQQCAMRSEELDSLASAEQSEWDIGEVLNVSVPVRDSIYHHLFGYLCTDLQHEVKAWVIWESGLTLRVAVRRFTVQVRVCIEGFVIPYSFNFEENESLSTVVRRLNEVEREVLQRGKIGYWQLRQKRDAEEVIRLLKSKEKLNTFAERIPSDSFTSSILSVLNSPFLIVVSKPSLKTKLTSLFASDDSAIGIENLGNTCFLNCVLQSLAHIPQLALWYFKTQGDRSKPLNWQLGDLVKSKYAKEVETLVPSELKQTLGVFDSRYAETRQQDADELLMTLLNRLISEESQDLSSSLPLPTPLSSALSAILSHLSTNCCFLTTQFLGMYRETLTCENCRHSTVRFVPFCTHSLNLTPMQLYTVRLISHRPEAAQSTFRVDIESPLEQENSLLSVWSAINDKTGCEQLILGEWKNGKFVGPLPLDYVPSSWPVVAFTLPTFRENSLAVIFDVWETNTNAVIGTRVIVCSESALIEDLPRLVVDYLAEVGNSFIDRERKYKKWILKKIQREEVREMRSGVKLWVKVGSEEMRAEGWTFGNTVGSLREGQDGKKELRIRCEFQRVPKPLQEALKSFKEDKNKTVKTYSEKALTVTLSQLLSYNCREQRIEGTSLCDECRVYSPRSFRQEVERFPRISVFPIIRGILRSSGLEKSRMEVCFPAESLDLSAFEVSANSSPAVYDLSSVITHVGKGVSSGHYIAYARHPVNAGWYYCSDRKCGRVKIEEVMRCREASMLVYIRR